MKSFFFRKTPWPLANTYWVKKGRLLAGEYPGDPDPETALFKTGCLIRSGIRVFMDLTEEGEFIPYDIFLNLPHTAFGSPPVYERYQIPEGGIPGSTLMTCNILDSIDRYVAEGDSVYLHSGTGKGRAAAVAGCWLSRHGSTGQAGLERLNDLWEKCAANPKGTIPGSSIQREYVRNWKEDIQH